VNKRIYLADPEVFLVNARDDGARNCTSVRGTAWSAFPANEEKRL
jgi:hypothetical protein